MEKQQAIFLANQLSTLKNSAIYELKELDTAGQSLQGFHQWANGKPLVAAFSVMKRGDEGYYFLLIDWHRNNNYYLVIYMHDKSTTVCEIQRVTVEGDRNVLSWKYNPLKRDGKNDLRKAFFQKKHGTTTVDIPLPQSPYDVENFLDQLFSLCRHRIHADKSPAIFE